MITTPFSKNTPSRRMASVALIVIPFVVMIIGCALTVKKPPLPPLKPTANIAKIAPGDMPSFRDDLDQASLITAIDRSLMYLNRTDSNARLTLGDRIITPEMIKKSLVAFRDMISCGDPPEVLQQKVRESFDLYKLSSLNGNKQVLITGYFESVLNGSFTKTDIYKYPIYCTPDDLLIANLRKFNKKYAADQLIGRVEGHEFIPYFNREDIDFKGVLEGRDLEIVWVDDQVGLFTMHTQGSGKIRLSDGTFIHLSYSQRNGRPFRSDSRVLLELGKIERQNLSYRNVKSYLRSHPDEIPDVFRRNESYVFFRIVEDGPVGATGVPLVPNRSIAVDPDVYPLGAIALLTGRKPEVDEKGQVTRWIPFTRFVLCQDTGGLIKGQHIDLYCGSGDDAENVAGSYKEQGDLYILLLKAN